LLIRIEFFIRPLYCQHVRHGVQGVTGVTLHLHKNRARAGQLSDPETMHDSQHDVIIFDFVPGGLKI
jgi:hypothetical protein